MNDSVNIFGDAKYFSDLSCSLTPICCQLYSPQGYSYETEELGEDSKVMDT